MLNKEVLKTALEALEKNKILIEQSKENGDYYTNIPRDKEIAEIKNAIKEIEKELSNIKEIVKIRKCNNGGCSYKKDSRCCVDCEDKTSCATICNIFKYSKPFECEELEDRS